MIENLRNVERGGKVFSQGAGVCASMNVSVFTICCSVIKSGLMKAGQGSFCIEGWPTLDHSLKVRQRPTEKDLRLSG